MCDKSFLVLSSAPFSPCFLKFFTYRIIFVSPPSYHIIFVSPPCILLYSCLMESNGIFQVALFLNQLYITDTALVTKCPRWPRSWWCSTLLLRVMTRRIWMMRKAMTEWLKWLTFEPPVFGSPTADFCSPNFLNVRHRYLEPNKYVTHPIRSASYLKPYMVCGASRHIWKLAIRFIEQVCSTWVD